jgi:hypothetical protein
VGGGVDWRRGVNLTFAEGGSEAWMSNSCSSEASPSLASASLLAEKSPSEGSSEAVSVVSCETSSSDTKPYEVRKFQLGFAP